MLGEHAVSNAEILGEIQQHFGFIPPFYAPALDFSLALENLWRQTLTAYLNNPLPATFKDLLFAHLARYCQVPYGMLCHPGLLHPLAMKPDELVAIMRAPASELRGADFLVILDAIQAPFNYWPAPDTLLAETVLNCALLTFLDARMAQQYRPALSRLLGNAQYDYLVLFLSYVKVCHLWVETHPELVYELDLTVIQAWINVAPAGSSSLLPLLQNIRDQLRAGREEDRQEEQPFTPAVTIPAPKDVHTQWHVQSGNIYKTGQDLLEISLRMTQEAHKQTSELEAIFDAITDVIICYDQQGNIILLNAAGRAETTLCRDEHLTLQERWSKYQLLDEDGQLLTFQQYPPYRVLQGETLRGATAARCMVYKPDHSLTYYTITGSVVRDSEGNISGGVLIIRDVTERRKLAQRTREALNALLEMAEILVHPGEKDIQEATGLQADAVGQRLVELARRVLNFQFAAIVAVEGETGTVKPLAVSGLKSGPERNRMDEAQLFHLSDYLNESVIGRMHANEIVILNPALEPFENSSTYDIGLLLLAPLLVGGRLVGVLGVVRGTEKEQYTQDEIALVKAMARLAALVIERDRLLNERAQAQANMLALRDSHERMNTFLSIASHELRTPVTTIQGFADILQMKEKRHQRFDESGKRALMMISEQTEHLAHLIEDMLDLSCIENEQIVLRMAPHDLVACLAQVVESQAMVARHHRLRLILQGISATDTLIGNFDAARIMQVLTNLISNAVKYSAVGSEIEVGLRYAEDVPELVLMWVKDRGIGIDAAELPHIFERFRRARTAEMTTSGLGIGLYLVREFVTQHGGRVWAKSEQGVGSTFFVELPLHSNA